MLYVLIPVEHIDRCNHIGLEYFFPGATVAHPQSVKDDAIDCIRRPLQHRDRAHVSSSFGLVPENEINFCSISHNFEAKTQI